MRIITVKDDGTSLTIFDDDDPKELERPVINLIVEKYAEQQKRTQTPISVRIGKTIHQRRQQLGMTLKELSSCTQISLGYISQIEHGAHTPSIYMLNRLSQALEIKLVEFFN